MAAGHGGGEAGGWLWTIAARRLVDARRVQERSARIGTAPLDTDGVERAPAAALPSAEDRVPAGLEFGDVGAALARISPELREVLIPAAGGAVGRAVTVWAWPVQPGDRPWAWLTAVTAFVLGTALYAARGARPEHARG
ncbi:hypothetical protein RKD18_003204 [Streptomyces phaeoluteigriseus]